MAHWLYQATMKCVQKDTTPPFIQLLHLYTSLSPSQWGWAGRLRQVEEYGCGMLGKRVTAGDSGASGVSDTPRVSNQVHFFISSYPCQALQLADQQSAAVCFNQRHLHCYRQGQITVWAKGRRMRSGPKEGGGRMSSPQHHRAERDEAGDTQIQHVQN